MVAEAAACHDLVYVDTPGLNPFSPEDMGFLRGLTRAVEVEPVLVMAAGGDPVEATEVAEAFAAVGIASMRELGISDDIVNVNGGAIALGHPIGMSGNRLALTLLHELKRRGGGMGAAALCGGGGQGDALVVRTI